MPCILPVRATKPRGRVGPGREGGFVEGGSAGKRVADAIEVGFPLGTVEINARFEGIDRSGGRVYDLNIRKGGLDLKIACRGRIEGGVCSVVRVGFIGRFGRRQ